MTDVTHIDPAKGLPRERWAEAGVLDWRKVGDSNVREPSELELRLAHYAHWANEDNQSCGLVQVLNDAATVLAELGQAHHALLSAFDAAQDALAARSEDTQQTLQQAIERTRGTDQVIEIDEHGNVVARSEDADEVERTSAHYWENYAHDLEAHLERANGAHSEDTELLDWLEANLPDADLYVPSIPTDKWYVDIGSDDSGESDSLRDAIRKAIRAARAKEGE